MVSNVMYNLRGIRSSRVQYKMQNGSEAVYDGLIGEDGICAGVEMEALTAVTVAALTVYDMCKAVSKTISISDIRLEAKNGGRSGDWRRGVPSHRAIIMNRGS